jgi:RHS repeat-associated protein
MRPIAALPQATPCTTLRDQFRWIRRSVDNDGPASGTAVDTFFSHEVGQVALQFGGTTAASLSHRYVWNPADVDQLLADEAVTSLSSAGTVQYPLGDHLGTLRDLASYNVGTNTTTIDNHRRYDSYGNLTSETNAAVDQLFGFTGRALDESTGLQNNLNRWYDPLTGRWISEDPIGFAAGDMNLYRYVENSTLDFVDPEGLNRWCMSAWGLHSFILVEIWDDEGTTVIGYKQLHFDITGHTIIDGLPTGWSIFATAGYPSNAEQDRALIELWEKMAANDKWHDAPLDYFGKLTCLGETLRYVRYGGYKVTVPDEDIKSDSPRLPGVPPPPPVAY